VSRDRIAGQGYAGAMSGRRTDPRSTERPDLEPVRADGTPRAVATGGLIVAVLAALVWHPWGSTGRPASSPESHQATAIAEAPGPSAIGPTGEPAASVPAGASPTPLAVDAVPVTYRSLIDNEWTIVALLTPGSTASEEPVIPHVPPPPWSADGPFLILQQGLGGASTQRRTTAGGPGGVCSVASPPRARPAIHLPADRVAFLGLTYPGMGPGATITAAVLGASGASIAPVASPIVRLDGVTPPGRYVLPSSGLGAAALFGSTQPGILPTDAYRFEVSLPGVAGPRYLYACIGT
jgi:hypothetical protein